MRWYLGIAVMFLCLDSLSQNLVPNGSFEDTLCIENGFLNPFYSPLEHWFNPNIASPDYFTSSDNIPCYFHSIYDTNWSSIGEWQSPQDGNNFVALYGRIDNSITREFLELELVEPLISDSSYCITMYVSLSNNSQFAIDRFGIYFSEDSVYDHDWGGWFDIENYIATEPGNFLSDTVEWMPIEGVYVAQGNEKFVLIGNSFDNDETQYVQFYPDAGFTNAYYYVDNVSLERCAALESVELKNQNTSVYPNPTSGLSNLTLPKQEPTNIFIYNLQGKLLKELQSNTQEIQIELPEQGVYLIQVVGESFSSVVKVVKE